MLGKTDFAERFQHGIHMLDGATGTALINVGMPRGCCQEAWLLEHPEVIAKLQRRYAEAGSEIIYAPTFQANPLALSRYGLENQVDEINARLIAVSWNAAPGCLIAGNLTTLRAYLDTADDGNFEKMTAVYRSQIHALVQGGADLLAAETLLHPMEAKAVLRAAGEEGAPAVMISFALKSDGMLRSGHDAEKVFADIERAGAAAVGMNCIAADELLPPIVKRLGSAVSVPLICKPNTGRAVNGVQPVDMDMFTTVMQRCVENGASLIGGCCGTAPEHIAALRNLFK